MKNTLAFLSLGLCVPLSCAWAAPSIDSWATQSLAAVSGQGSVDSADVAGQNIVRLEQFLGKTVSEDVRTAVRRAGSSLDPAQIDGLTNLFSRRLGAVEARDALESLGSAVAQLRLTNVSASVAVFDEVLEPADVNLMLRRYTLTFNAAKATELRATLKYLQAKFGAPAFRTRLLSQGLTVEPYDLPRFRELYSYVASRLGEARAQEMLRKNPNAFMGIRASNVKNVMSIISGYVERLPEQDEILARRLQAVGQTEIFAFDEFLTIVEKYLSRQQIGLRMQSDMQAFAEANPAEVKKVIAEVWPYLHHEGIEFTMRRGLLGFVRTRSEKIGAVIKIAREYLSEKEVSEKLLEDMSGFAMLDPARFEQTLAELGTYLTHDQRAERLRASMSAFIGAEASRMTETFEVLSEYLNRRQLTARLRTDISAVARTSAPRLRAVIAVYRKFLLGRTTVGQPSKEIEERVHAQIADMMRRSLSGFTTSDPEGLEALFVLLEKSIGPDGLQLAIEKSSSTLSLASADRVAAFIEQAERYFSPEEVLAQMREHLSVFLTTDPDRIEKLITALTPRLGRDGAVASLKANFAAFVATNPVPLERNILVLDEYIDDADLARHLRTHAVEVARMDTDELRKVLSILNRKLGAGKVATALGKSLSPLSALTSKNLAALAKKWNYGGGVPGESLRDAYELLLEADRYNLLMHALDGPRPANLVRDMRAKAARSARRGAIACGEVFP